MVALIVVGSIALGLMCLLWVRERQHAKREERWDSERSHLTEANTEERRAWAEERRDLNNRIQVPEAAPFMGPEEASPDRQYVPFDDDAAFAAAQEEYQWP